MLLLVASLVALPIGPALMAMLSRSQRAFVALDAFMVVAITGLVMLHIVPESVAHAGWPALVALLFGLALPAALHGAQDSCHNQRSPGIFLALAMGALALHALLDGVALVPSYDGAASGAAVLGTPLALGVVLHRLMEGAGIWWLTGSQTPVQRRILALGAVGAMTLLGFWGGAFAVTHGALAAIACVQAMVAGSLLHVLMRHGPQEQYDHGAAMHRHTPGGRPALMMRLASAAGGGGAMALLWALHVADGHHHHGAAGHHHDHSVLMTEGYLQIMGTAIGPAVLWALVTAALMHMVVPTWHSPVHGARPGWAAAWGTVQGLLLAPCSCGVVPLYRRLLARGAPDAQALAYLLAAPGLGLVTLAVSCAILGPTFTVVRVAGAIVLSGGVALMTGTGSCDVSAAKAPQDHAGKRHQHSRITVLGRMMDGLAFALGEVADFTGPWLLFGLLVATLCGDGLDPAWLTALASTHLTVPVMALLALPLYVCGSASTLIAAVLLAKGLSVGGALTFVWAASMLSPAALSAVRGRYGRRKGLTVIAAVFFGVVLAGSAAQTYAPGVERVQQVLMAPTAAHVTAAAWALWVLLAWAIARQGVRPAVDQIAMLNRDGSPSHHHGSHA